MSIKLAARLFVVATSARALTQSRSRRHDDKGALSLEQVLWALGLLIAGTAALAVIVTAITSRTAQIR
jgi:hypothetical protein